MRSLTIALPTWNRERLLDRQLEWLSVAIRGHESRLAIFISDNCSDDRTPEVIERWLPAFHNVPVEVHRNRENIGAVRNIAHCVESARTRHVWTISDDDPIDPDAIGYVLAQLDSHPDLALMVLNFSSRNVRTGALNFEQCYPRTTDRFERDGRHLFRDLLTHDSGGVTLTTALVYRTDAAQEAAADWSQGVDNLVWQLYISGYCAARGPALLTGRNFLECAAGDHHFLVDPALQRKMVDVDIPIVYARLLEVGYSRWMFGRIFVIKAWRNARPSRVGPFLRRVRRLLATLWQNKAGEADSPSDWRAGNNNAGRQPRQRLAQSTSSK